MHVGEVLHPGIPMRTTGSRKYASSLATIKSHTQASIRPPAMQAPWTMAMVGLASRASAGTCPVHLLLTGVEELAARLVDMVVPQAHALEALVDVTPWGADVVPGGEVLAGPRRTMTLTRSSAHARAKAASRA